jgi:Zn ribbon nucleic-acid-binding protein
MSEVKCPNCQATTHIKQWKCSDDSIQYQCLWCGNRWRENIKSKLKAHGYSEEAIKQILVWYP